MQEKGFTEITPDQYFELMINQVCGDYSKFIKTNILLESRQFKPSKQAYRASVKQTVQCLFKGKKSLKYEQLLKFRLGILRQLFEFEFLSFPGSQDNKIDGVDFARSIIKYIESSKRRSYLKRIVQYEQMCSIEITKQSYIGFHLFMQTYLQELRNLLNQKGALTLNDIMNIVNKYSNKSERVEQGQIKVLMMLLDTDSSGFIEKRELLGVLNRLEYYTTVKSGETTLSELLWQDWEAIKSKLNKIKDILQE